MKYYLNGKVAAYDKRAMKYFICQDVEESRAKSHGGREWSEEHASYYFDTFADLRGRSFDVAIDNIRRLTGGETTSVLDIGCSYGLFLKKVLEQGWDGWGVEPSENEARFAQERFDLQVSASTVEDFVTDKKWDVVTLWDVLEHLPNPVDALNKIAPMLSADGLLIIRVPNANGFIHRLAFVAYAATLGLFNYPLVKLFENHHYIYTDVSLSQLLKQTGFEVILSYGECMILPRADVIRQKRYIKKIPKPLQGPLSHILVAVLRLSEVLSMKDSLVVYSRQSC
jgi:2-polyprenyl-3-methyl-5-hydroxy-6-metoxy-1,4-benzoquinol methylase